MLEKEYEPVVFFYNPNIAPVSEYAKRLDEIRNFSRIKDFSFIKGDFDIRQWTARVKEHRNKGESSERCYECIFYRLEESFRKAAELDISYVTTTLSVSPHKNAAMINRAGRALSEESGIRFIEADFKKSGGYQRSVELSRSYGFYRQSWCGCVYSRRERRRKVSPPSSD